MAYFFQYIDTRPTSKKYENSEIIYNLDEFHTIRRNKNIISGYRQGKDASISLAICKSQAGAKYIMQCIMDRVGVDLFELSHQERVM